MGRRVHVMEVVDPAVWREVEAVVDLPPLIEADLGPTRRALRRGSERAVVPALMRRGLSVLVRPARGPAAQAPPTPVALPALSDGARRLLHKAQRRAVRGVVNGARVWHPLMDRVAIEELVRAKLLTPVGEISPMAAWQLRGDLPPPPEPAWDLEDAFFDPPADLEDGPGRIVGLVHDAGALAAAIRHVLPRRTHQGHLDRASGRQLGRRLHDRALVETGDLDRGDPRWARALDLLLGLEVVVEDPVQRVLGVRHEPLMAALGGDWLDAMLRRMALPELLPLFGAARAAIAQAGTRAVDEVVLRDLLAEQQGGAFTSTEEGFVAEEGPLLEELVGLLHALGLVRRAPGAFAPTADGHLWAGDPPPAAAIWVTSDLEIVVPPHALSPQDRYQLERLAHPTSRDVVDRLRLDRGGLADWLVDGDVDEAVALLRRLARAVPGTVVDTLRAWGASLTRIVLVQDVELDEP